MQKFSIKTGAAVLFTVAAFLAPGAVSAADNNDAIDYRQHIMKAMDAQTANIGMILSGAGPEEELQKHFDALAVMAASSLASFKQNVPGGESNPEVWTKWADFEMRMNNFATATADVAKLLKANGKDAIMSEFVKALACKGCHDVYRKK